MVEGACLCGAVRFEIGAPAQFINYCHCSMCRKVSGSAFGSFLHAHGSSFRWVAGQSSIAQYESSPGNFRAFCRTCGASVPVLEDNGSHVIVPAGTINGDPLVRPVVHIHTASKAPWHEITDALPQFEAFPPQEFWAPYE